MDDDLEFAHNMFFELMKDEKQLQSIFTSDTLEINKQNMDERKK